MGLGNSRIAMSLMENSDPKETPARPFRFNPKVVQMAALMMVALALPVTLAILGIRDIRQASRESESEPAPEITSLRGALESVVDAQWSTPNLPAGTRKSVREVADGDACLKAGEALQKLARSLDATVLSPEKIEAGGTRWIIQIPAGQVPAFEKGLGELGFAGVTESPGSAVTILYEVEIPIRP